MTISELLIKFSDPGVIQSLSMTDKMVAGAVTTILGMGITFSALIILQFVISWMNTLLNRSTEKTTTREPHKNTPETQNQPLQDNTELIAVISSVIAMQMTTSVDNIVIKNITRTENLTPVWNRAGIAELMNNRL